MMTLWAAYLYGCVMIGLLVGIACAVQQPSTAFLALAGAAITGCSIVFPAVALIYDEQS